MNRVLISIAFLLNFLALSVSANSEPVCGERALRNGLSFEYCIRMTDRTKTEDIVYFFHGLGGNAQTWFTQTEGTKWIDRHWAHKGYKPTVVTLSFGEAWLLVNTEEYPLLPAFASEIMPFLEGQVGGLRGGRRLLMGQSMGGFNSVQASLQLPGVFNRVALMCPAITTVGPYDSQEQIEDYIARTGARRDWVNLMLGISREFFRSDEEWSRHNPFTLLQSYSHAVKPVFLVSTGVRDEFGFQEGSALFVRDAANAGFFATWIPVPGGHCLFDRSAVATFMLEGRR